MHGVTITDSTEDGRLLAFDLTDILQLLDPAATDSEWEISGVECVGGTAADELHRLAEAKARVPGQSLLPLAADVAQVIDGVFVGYQKDEERPWVIIRAVDSSAFDLQTDDEEVLTKVKQRFRDVTDLSARESLPRAQSEAVTETLTGPKLAER